MASQKEKEILELLKHSGAGFRGEGIAKCIQNRINTPAIANALLSLKSDTIKVIGRPISSYAIAALDIVGIEKYTGSDQDIKALIQGLPIAFKIEAESN